MAGRAVELTVTEYVLLRVLAVNAGHVVPSETLLDRVWPGHDDADPTRVRVFAKQVRDKLGAPAWIVNRRGFSYFMPKPGA